MVNATRNGPVAPEGTSIDSLKTMIEELSRNIQSSQAVQAQMNERLNGMFLQHQHFQTELQKMKNGEGTSQRNNAQWTRCTKLEFPKFDGSDVKGWIYRSRQFFAVDQIEDDDKIRIVSIHLQGKALTWNQQFIRLNGENVDWEVYEAAIQKRFGSAIEDPLSELKNLRQTSTVTEYHDEFEMLKRRDVTLEISEKHAISLFLGGLKKDIELAVRMFKPKSIEDAFTLAKLQEDMAAVTNKRYTPIIPSSRNNTFNNTSKNVYSNYNQSKSIMLPPANTQLALPSTTTTTANPQPKTNNLYQPRKRLSQKELEEKRAKGQCFYCDQRYAPGYKCPGQLYSLEVLAEEDYGETVMEEEEGNEDYQELSCGDVPHISMNALTGTNAYQTMRVKGQVNKCHVQILIDSGSTHNFMDVAVAKKLGCIASNIAPLHVFIPGGGKTLTTNKCVDFQWQMGGHTFKSDMLLLQIGGCDMVLGIQWLETLGDIMWNFEKLMMTFKYAGIKVVLRGQKSSATMVEGKRLSRVVNTPQIQLNAMCLYVYPIQLCNMELPKASPTQEVQHNPELTDLLKQYADVFAVPRSLPPKRECDHRILLIDGTQPVNVRPYRHPPSQKDAIEVMVKELLEAGIIRPSHSPFSSPIVMVKKKDGTWRMCVDYRELNAKTIKDRFPIPIIEELIDELNGSMVFTKLDLRSGYHQIRMFDDDIAKTAFRTHDGHYEFLVMPFDLTNAPSTFQSLMNKVFKPFLRKFTLVFFDDILVYSPDMETHLQHLQQILEVMRSNTLFAKESKCVFATSQVEYLGHVISAKGVATDPTKIEAVRNFVKNYAVISQPLTKLLKKDAFKWSEDATAAFNSLKQHMMQAPVLKMPDFTQPFVIETDASGIGIGAVLQQNGYPITFMSKTLSHKHQSLSTYEREFLAIIHAVEKWRGYLLDRHFKIVTDHVSLKYLTGQRLSTPTQLKWLPKLIGLDYEIQYKKGNENGAADALSRIEERVQLFNICATSIMSDVYERVKLSVEQDVDLQLIKSKVQLQDPRYHNYTVKDGNLYKKGKLVVGSDEDLR
ncbi:uncharacterized protein [Rutidosis leptorrhynchoides]|uniref:uncharacterized protein n=1 Tax=Rutidosis leptorrhynchoides TaxID=125765 RepID=UPI003A98D0C3